MKFLLGFILMMLFVYSGLKAQNNDCVTAEVICSSGPVAFNPAGPGMNDFANPANNSGCLLGNEHQSAWYYFQFQPTMPPNSVITFTITPNAGAGQDYDFAIFGPDVQCGALGFPVRCSFADQFCAFCPDTGLGMGATDTSEPPSGDGFVAPMVVQPGQGFYLLIDNFLSTSSGFSMTWGGSAAPFLDCTPPMCNVNLTATQTYNFCEGAAPFQLTANATGVTNAAFYEWTSSNGGEAYLSNPFIRQPILTVPPGFSGTLNYTLTVTDGNCMDDVNVTVNILPGPDPIITGPTQFCQGTTISLNAGSGYSSYQWSTGGTGQSVTVGSSATVSVTVTNAQGCPGVAMYTVTALPAPMPSIFGDPYVCNGVTATLSATPGYGNYTWSNNSHNQEIMVNAAGNFGVTVTDENGCSGSAQFIVTNRPNPTPVISGPTQICPGSTATLSANSGYFDYIWSNNSPSQTSTINAPGTYSVTVEDGFGCRGSSSYNVTAAPVPMPVINGVLGFCPGQSTTLNLTQAFSSYSWSNGQTGQSTTFNTPGPQSVTVTNSANCTATLNFSLQEFQAPMPVISGDLDICPGENTTLSVPAGFSTYAWSPVAGSSNTITASNAGAYTVTVTNGNGCSGADTAMLIHHPVPMPVISGDTAICIGEQSTLNAGAGYSSYLWSNNADTSIIQASAAGVYSVTVTNAMGCAGSDQFNLSVNQLPAPVISGDTAVCAGQNSVLDAGAGYASYSWEGGQNTMQITVSTADTFQVTVTDANGCSGSDSFILTVNPNPVPTISGNLSYCSGSNTLLDAGAGYTSYLWSGGDTTAVTSVNMPGNQSVTVTDGNGCMGSDTVVVSELTELMPVISGNLSFCTGTSTTLTAASGYASYQWSNSMSGPSITVNAPGIYTVSVTDTGECSGSGSVQVNALTLPQPQITGAASFCAGSTTTLDAGPGYNAYAWSTSSTQQTSSISQPGNYTVTVTDGNGCQGSDDFSIVQTALPVPSISGTPGFCPGLSTELSVPGNYASYLWSDNSNNPFLSVNAPGTYSVTVTDDLGCEGNTAVDVSEFNTTNPVISGNPNYCPGASTLLNASPGFSAYEWQDGTATASIVADQVGLFSVTATDSNGCETTASVQTATFAVIPPTISGLDEFCTGGSTTLTAQPGYNNYIWSDNSPGAILVVNAGGIYTVTATDANGCDSETSVQVIQHPLPTPSISGSLSYCIGGQTTLNAGGAYAGYNWTGGSTNASLVVNTPGNYGLTVTDNNGCIGSTQVAVVEDTELSPVISGPAAYCENGSATLDAGVGFATYTWNGNPGTQTLVVTSPGVYLLSVTDGMGCSGTASVNVIENPLPQPQISGATDFCADASSTLNAGTGYAAYLWSNGSVNPLITVTDGGIYGVTVTDNNGCINQTSLLVTEHPLPQFTIEGDPFFCEGAVANLTTNPGFTAYYWSTSETLPAIQVTTEGAYQVTVTDVNGCQSSASFFTDLIPLPLADGGPDQNLDCIRTSTTIGGAGSSQGAAYAYMWTGPGITPDNSDDRFPLVGVPGTYTLVINDLVHGCQSLPASLMVNDLAYTPAVNLSVSDVLDCNTATATIDGAGSETGAGIVYSWFNSSGVPIPGATGISYTTAQAGAYTLRITDTQTGCEAQQSATVQADFNYPHAEAGPPRHLNCLITDATLDASGSQSGPGITYSWNTQNGHIQSGINTINPGIDAPGTYVLTVTNIMNGCASTDAVSVTEDIQAPQADAGLSQELDCLHPVVTLNGSGSGNAGLAFSWTLAGNPAFSASGASIEAALPGTYTLLVTNTVNGCTASDPVLVTLNSNRPTAMEVVLNHPTCFGDKDGSILISDVTGGTPPYIYSINGQAFSNRLVYNSLTANEYEIVVQDAIGCEYTVLTALNPGNDLQVDAGPDRRINLGETTDLAAQVNISYDALDLLRWTTRDSLTCSTCPQITVGPFETMTYQVMVVDSNGCEAKDLVTVFVAKNRDVFIPNVFSPNNDGINDVLMVFAGHQVARIKSFLVFNRWGEPVFEAYDFLPNDPLYGWNGFHRGLLCNTAVFVYLAEIEFIDGEVVLFKGDATLMH